MKLKLCTILLFQLTLNACIAQKTNTNSETSCNENMIISCSGSDDAHYFPWRINEESCEVAGMNRTLLFQTKSGNFSLIFNTDTIIKCEIQSNPSDSDSGFLPFDDTYIVIAFAVILVLCIIITCLSTFIVTCVCFKRRYKKSYAELSKSQSMQEQISYDTVTHTGTITKNDLELQPNPAYGSGSKMTMNSNPAYKPSN